MTRFVSVVTVVLLVLGVGPAAAQDQPTAPAAGVGVVAGTVVDASSGEPLIDAGVEVVGKNRTVRTDLDGKYRLQLPPGTYQLRFFAAQYQSARIERVVVETGKVAPGDATLRPEGQAAVEVVEVVADAAKAAEATQILKRQKADVVEDNIGAETIKKTPDSDAAEVVERLPAVTVHEDRYIYVRGLNERYSFGLLEGSRLPSPDPDRRVVPLDLFPSDFLDSISIVKTYSPDLPGDFSGGLADLRLKEFPEKLTFSFNISSGATTGTTFGDFDTYKGGGLDYFGFDQNVRSLPSIIPDKFKDSDLTPAREQAFGRSFKNIYDIDSTTAPPNFGVGFSMGNTLGPVGFTLAGTYDTEYKTRTQIERQLVGDIDDPENVHPQEDYTFDFSTFDVRLGGLFTLAYEIDPKHRISLRTLINRNTTDEVQSGNGTDENIQDAALTSQTLTYTQEELDYGQVQGEHHWSWLDMNWRSAFSRTTQEVPDQRFLFRVNGQMEFTGLNSSGDRAFTDLTEYLSDSAMDFTIPFTTGLPGTDVWSGLPASVKFGPAYSFRDRDFTLRQFKFQPGNDRTLFDLGGSPEDVFTPENIYPGGIQFGEVTLPQNAYTSSQEIAGVYAMTELPIVKDRFRIIAGARGEYSYIKVNVFDVAKGRNVNVIKNDLDPMPAISLVYSPRSDMNVRFGWSRTVSRPDFRELSPAIYPEGRGLRGRTGNVNLVETHIESFDLRWEWFFSPSELVSFGPFYKDLDQPIEQTLLRNGGNLLDSFANSESAWLVGFEFELRKNFGFASPWLQNLFWQTNVTYAHSNVDAGDAEEFEATISTDRELQGQAPFIVNTSLEYAHPDYGTLRLLYNTAGDTLDRFSGVEGVPDIFQSRRDELDFVYLVTVAPFGAPINLKLAAENVLNDNYEYTQGNGITRDYKTGVKFSLGLSYNY